MPAADRPGRWPPDAARAPAAVALAPRPGDDVARHHFRRMVERRLLERTGGLLRGFLETATLRLAAPGDPIYRVRSRRTPEASRDRSRNEDLVLAEEARRSPSPAGTARRPPA